MDKQELAALQDAVAHEKENVRQVEASGVEVLRQLEAAKRAEREMEAVLHKKDNSADASPSPTSLTGLSAIISKRRCEFNSSTVKRMSGSSFGAAIPWFIRLATNSRCLDQYSSEPSIGVVERSLPIPT